MRRILQGMMAVLGLSLACSAFAWTTITVQPGQSIDSIAEKYQPSGVSAMDMIIAVRSANPGVEHKGLQPGVKLKVPTTSTEVRQAITGEMGGAPAKAAPASAKAVPAKTTTTTKATVAKVKPARPAPKATPKTTSKSTGVTPQKAVVPAASVATANQIAGYKATIAKLQQAFDSQTHSIQTYQAQIADLTNQLNNNAVPAPVTKSSEFFSFADLWFVVWLITLIFLWRSRVKPQVHPVREDDASVTPVAPMISIVAEGNAPSPLTKKTETKKDVDRIEPKLHDMTEEEWRQVELDIPASDAPAQTHMSLSPAFTPEEELELTGEQQNIIDAIASDHDNLEWHMALLEFYIKTMNDGAFKRHMDTMIHTGLMVEGDKLWEKIRKMYLNGWIYKEEIA